MRVVYRGGIAKVGQTSMGGERALDHAGDAILYFFLYASCTV